MRFNLYTEVIFGGMHMKKLLFVALLVILALGLASTALGDPGESAWSYEDLYDLTGAKYEGGYAAFDVDLNQDGTMDGYGPDAGDGSVVGGDATGPHGGYNTTTNKCKVCHAVHRADGAYYLLRADSQDDACSYCHIGSAHSSRVVYDLNPDGIYTTNGHTIGASSAIPDSSILQQTKDVTLETVDADMNPVSETIKVRTYDSQRVEMYRFARHHGQSAVSYNRTSPSTNPADWTEPFIDKAARSGYQKIGPLALRCMSCHQPHNATNEVWRPRAFAPWTSETYSSTADGAFSTTGYKLLRRSPAGQTIGAPSFTSASDPTEYYGANQVVKAIEDNAVAGTNFSQNRSGDFTYTENGVTRVAPLWVAQDIHAPSGDQTVGSYRYPNKVNTAALSWWCADCHNLNIGGWEPLHNEELGFKAHNERTHPAPFYGAYTGPGQCYSCHRNDLPAQMGLTAGGAINFEGNGAATPAAIDPARNSCTQCHYGTADYYMTRMNPATAVESDFPHSGSENDIKLLGAYSVSNTRTDGTWAPQYDATTVDSNSLDQVCLRCHPGIGVNH